MKFPLFLLTALLVAYHPIAAAAQSSSYAITGHIRDAETGEPLEGASVYLMALQKGVASDSTGTFRFTSLNASRYPIRITYIGYQPVDTVLSVPHSSIWDIQLQPATLTLGDVLVTAARDSLLKSTRSFTIIDKATLDRNRGQTFAAALENVPGVTTLNTGPAISKPVIRGLHSQRIVTLNHGIAQEGQQWGGEHAPEIDPFTPDRIEIIKGAAGVEYGLGAIGGVIKVSEAPIDPNNGIHGEAYLNAYSNNAQGASSLKLSGGSNVIPGLGWRLQGSIRRAGSSRTPRDVLGNTGFYERDYAATVAYNHANLSHNVYFSHFETELGIFRGAHIGNYDDLLRAIDRGRPINDYDFSYRIDAPKQHITHNLLRYKATYVVPQKGNLELQYGYQWNHRQEFDAHRLYTNNPDLLNRPAFDLTLKTHTADLSFAHAPAEGFNGKVGINGIAQTNVRNGSGFLIPNFRSYTGGLFAHEEWQANRFRLEAGVRYDLQWRRIFPVENRNVRGGDYTYSNYTAVVGSSYTLTDQWSVSAMLASAWRPPTISEQFSNGVHHGTAQYEQGDPALGYEQGYNGEVGLRHESARWFLQLSSYYHYINNYIFLEPNDQPIITIRGSFPSFSYRATDALLRGVDGLAEWYASRQLRLGASASIVRGTDRSQNEPLIYMPADRLSLTGTYQLPNAGRLTQNKFSISVQGVRHQDRFPANLDYAPPPDGYGLVTVDAGTAIRTGSHLLRLSGTLQNAFNATYRDYLSRYRYYADDIGRNFILKAQLTF